MADKLIISERDDSNGKCIMLKHIASIDWYGHENEIGSKYTIRILRDERIFGKYNAEVIEYFDDKQACLERRAYLIEQLKNYLANE